MIHQNQRLRPRLAADDCRCAEAVVACQPRFLRARTATMTWYDLSSVIELRGLDLFDREALQERCRGKDVAVVFDDHRPEDRKHSLNSRESDSVVKDQNHELPHSPRSI